MLCRPRGGAAAGCGRAVYKYDLCNQVWRDERKLPDPSALLSKKARHGEDFYKKGVFLAHQVAAMQAELAPLVGATLCNINQEGDFEALPRTDPSDPVNGESSGSDGGESGGEGGDGESDFTGDRVYRYPLSMESSAGPAGTMRN